MPHPSTLSRLCGHLVSEWETGKHSAIHPAAALPVDNIEERKSRFGRFLSIHPAPRMSSCSIHHILHTVKEGSRSWSNGWGSIRRMVLGIYSQSVVTPFSVFLCLPGKNQMEKEVFCPFFPRRKKIDRNPLAMSAFNRKKYTHCIHTHVYCIWSMDVYSHRYGPNKKARTRLFRRRLQ